MTAPTTYEIGTSLGAMLPLASLSTAVLNPESDFQEYSSVAQLGNGLTRGLGYPVVNWHYGFLTAAQYDVFRTFCSGTSAVVYIATIKNDGTFLRYVANMFVPEKYAIRADRYLDVNFEFTHLVAAE